MGIRWYEIKSIAEDITDGLLKLAVICGAWGIVAIILTVTYIFLTEGISECLKN